MEATRNCVHKRRRIGQLSRDAIRQAHDEVLEDLGKNAPYISKERIYSLVSERTGFSVSYIKNVLHKR